MKLSSLVRFGWFGVSTIIFRRKKAILGTIIVTDKCNLTCKHCSVNNKTGVIHPYGKIRGEMERLYKMGIRILFFSGGETFMWEDKGKTIRDLVIEAKAMGFVIVNVVTNGLFGLDLPEADILLLSIDGDRETHDDIRGETYDKIMDNLDNATASNIILYMDINQINKHCLRAVTDIAWQKKKVKAVSFNFHTPYPETANLALTKAEKQVCCDEITALMDEGYPIFNLKAAFPYIINNTFPRPCKQCIVIEDGEISTCGRCIHNEGLCDQCGYFFSAEYALAFSGKFKVIADMLRTYTKYI